MNLTRDILSRLEIKDKLNMQKKLELWFLLELKKASEKNDLDLVRHLIDYCITSYEVGNITWHPQSFFEGIKFLTIDKLNKIIDSIK
jgi:hypothetical protein